MTASAFTVDGIASGGSGTITNIATTVPITGGPITTTGTIALQHASVTPATYTNPTIAVDQFGLIQSAANGSPGAVVQRVSTETGIVATGTTIFPINNSAAQNTYGDQYMSLAVTPTNAGHILMIEVTIILSSSVGSVNGRVSVGLFQDSTVNAIATAICGVAFTSAANTCCFTHIMTAGTASATTFKVRAGTASAGTTTFNGEAGGQYYAGSLASSIIITEWTA